MTYSFNYGPDTPYARAVGLIHMHHHPDGAVVVDLGCGFGAIAEPVRSLSLEYLGIDLEPEGVESLRERGFEAATGDLGSPMAVVEAVEAALAGRKIAAVSMLDVVEHLTNAEDVLGAVRTLCERYGDAPLIVSIPNVTHLDLAVKLLMGRWDVTQTGLLDATHVRFFSETHLDLTMHSGRWEEIARDDFQLVFSDQHFPTDAVLLERETPVGALLTGLRQTAGPGAFVNQFVRAYRPAHQPADAAEEPMGQGPFLSVLVRTQGKRPATLQETLLSLAAQSCDDFEVLVLAHEVSLDVLELITAAVAEFHPSFSQRVRVVPISGGGRAFPLNEGARLARGSYVAMLDDDDLALGHWIDEFRAASARKPHHVARLGVAVQRVMGRPGLWGGQDGYEVTSKPMCRFPLEFDLLSHLHDNTTPNNGYAVPRSLIVDMHEEWDDSLPVLEDWDLLLRSAALCGVESCPTYGALVREWTNAENSLTNHSPEQWTKTRAAVIAKIDGNPLLLDRGSMTRIREVFHQRDALTQQLEAVHDALGTAYRALDETRRCLDDVYNSRSWRTTAFIRRVTGAVRRPFRR